MHTHEHRTWFPYILIGLTLLMAVGIYTWIHATATEEPNSTQRSYVGYEQTLRFAPSDESYKEQVLHVLGEYAQHKDENETHADLVDMVVPAEYKDLHIVLVLAFTKLQEGDIEGARARFDLLNSEYDWLQL